MKYLLHRFVKNESGATAIEYGLIAGLVSVAIITAFAIFSTDLSVLMNNIGATLKATPPE